MKRYASRYVWVRSWPLPEVKVSSLFFEVILYIIRRGLMRETSWLLKYNPRYIISEVMLKNYLRQNCLFLLFFNSGGQTVDLRSTLFRRDPTHWPVFFFNEKLALFRKSLSPPTKGKGSYDDCNHDGPLSYCFINLNPLTCRVGAGRTYPRWYSVNNSRKTHWIATKLLVLSH